MGFFENLAQFHFLRPLWLLGLFSLPLIWLSVRKRVLNGSDWSKAIDPKLLKYLMPKGQNNNKTTTIYSLTLLFTLCFVAMSGPTWQKKPQPVLKLTDNLVVILDLSLSMLASDTKPDRLTKTKQKLQDLLKLRKEGSTALVVFSGDSHVVTPLTDDTQTIIANLQVLDPFIMPVLGSRPDKAINQAIHLLEQGKASHGRIIMLTDGVDEKQIDTINNTLESTNISLSILAVGTVGGGPINIPGKGYFKDNGRVIIPKTNFTLLEKLAKKNHGLMHKLTLDDQDLNVLDISGERTLQQAHENQSEQSISKKYDSWQDMGYLFLLLIIPLALYGHRQGALIVIVLCLIFPTEKTYASTWDDLWQTKDQQAQTLFNQGKIKEAAKLFESPNHKANAYYKAQDYQKAQANFQKSLEKESKDKTTDTFYNQGNSLAKQQKFEEALEQYKKALELNPADEDSLYNKKLIEDFLKNQEKKDKDKQNKDQKDQKDQKDKKDQQKQDQQKQDQQKQDQQKQDQQKQDQQKQDQQKQDQQKQDQQKQDQQKQDQQKQDQQKQDQHSMKPKPDELSDEEKQSYEQWMRRVPDDPGALLRNKFEQQSIERRNSGRNLTEKGEPIW